MARMRTISADVTRNALRALPEMGGKATGKAADALTDDDANRIRARAERAMRNPAGVGFMTVGMMDQKGRQRRRARQTHPGKR